MNNRDLKYACFWIRMVRILNGIENLEAKPIDTWKKPQFGPKLFEIQTKNPDLE